MPTPAFNAAPWNAALFGNGGVTVGTDILYPALRIAGVLSRAGIGADEETISEALAALNALIDSWNTERLTIPALLRQVFALISGKGGPGNPYTIGNEGDFNTPRPSRIERAGLVDLANAAQPLETPLEVLNYQGWQAVTIKNQTTTLPSRLYYEATNPLGRIYLQPVPTIANQVALYLWDTLSQFETAADTFLLRPGYLRALQYNLAIELSPRFPHAELSDLSWQRAVATAKESKAKIKSLNVPNLTMTTELASRGTDGQGSWDPYSNTSR